MIERPWLVHFRLQPVPHTTMLPFKWCRDASGKMQEKQTQGLVGKRDLLSNMWVPPPNFTWVATEKNRLVSVQRKLVPKILIALNSHVVRAWYKLCSYLAKLVWHSLIFLWHAILRDVKIYMTCKSRIFPKNTALVWSKKKKEKRKKKGKNKQGKQCYSARWLQTQRRRLFHFATLSYAFWLYQLRGMVVWHLMVTAKTRLV